MTFTEFLEREFPSYDPKTGLATDATIPYRFTGEDMQAAWNVAVNACMDKINNTIIPRYTDERVALNMALKSISFLHTGRKPEQGGQL